MRECAVVSFLNGCLVSSRWLIYWRKKRESKKNLTLNKKLRNDASLWKFFSHYASYFSILIIFEQDQTTSLFNN